MRLTAGSEALAETWAGLRPLPTEEGWRIFEAALRSGLSQLLVLYGDRAKFEMFEQRRANRGTRPKPASAAPNAATHRSERGPPARFAVRRSSAAATGRRMPSPMVALR